MYGINTSGFTRSFGAQRGHPLSSVMQGLQCEVQLVRETLLQKIRGQLSQLFTMFINPNRVI